MKVLGISDSSVCGGATLQVDGKVIASINEERLNREKLSTGFPARAIRRVLQIGNLEPADIDRIQVADQHNYWKPESTYWKGWLVDHANKKKQIVATVSSSVSALAGNSPLVQSTYYKFKRRITGKRPATLAAVLRTEFGLSAPIEHIDHHACHATSAYYTSGFDSCTVITLDGGGDGLCSRVYRVRGGHFECINQCGSYHSIGNYYAYVTKICGFIAHKHEGKITGLAAHGTPKYRDLLERMIRFEEPQIRNRGNAYYWTAVRKIESALPRDFAIADLAASMQAVLEDAVSAYCQYWIRQAGFAQVALAGGVFANVRLNQRIHELDEVDELFIHPGMGDEGLSFGAAFTPEVLPDGYLGESIRHVYLGPEFSDREICQALASHGMDTNPVDDLEDRLAGLLARGFVVARFAGRLEYGPRALGNRSILYRPDDPSANNWLNKRLRRTEFMPFAPAVAAANRDRCFRGVRGAEHAARFMTITFDCTPEMEETCPGVVHLDRTARPQIVQREDNPSYYRIIEAHEALTGLPAIVNTSFNVHDEPIVCTPEDAIKGFEQGNLDYLAIGDHLIEGKNAKIGLGRKRRSQNADQDLVP